MDINNFDKSERFDESMNSRNKMKFGIDVLGVSMDQSITNQSIMSGQSKRRKLKKQKEDLDGSKIFREIDDDEEEKVSRSGGNKQNKKKKDSGKNIGNRAVASVSPATIMMGQNRKKGSNIQN